MQIFSNINFLNEFVLRFWRSCYQRERTINWNFMAKQPEKISSAISETVLVLRHEKLVFFVRTQGSWVSCRTIFFEVTIQCKIGVRPLLLLPKHLHSSFGTTKGSHFNCHFLWIFELRQYEQGHPVKIADDELVGISVNSRFFWSLYFRKQILHRVINDISIGHTVYFRK